jgi:hypothetical protein
VVVTDWFVPGAGPAFAETAGVTASVLIVSANVTATLLNGARFIMVAFALW